jgi:hypothetical protein
MNLQIQKSFFEGLKKALPPSISLADALSDLLNISVDSAYRRIRCSSALTLDEAMQIVQQFNIPLSALGLMPPNIVSFYVSDLGNKRQGFEDYLNLLHQDVKKVSEMPESQIVYASEDIPVFYHFSAKALSYFKMFYWMKGIQNVEDLEFAKFRPDMFGDFYEQTGQYIYKYYAKCRTTEVWTEETIHSTLGQIRFFWDAGFIEKKEFAFIIIKELNDIIDLIKLQVENSSKFFTSDSPTHKEFNFYLSDLMIGTNSVLVKAGDTRVSYISYNTFGSIKTISPLFADQTESWLNNLISKSTLVSGAGEKQRNQFFKKIQSSIDGLKLHIENN